MTRHRHYEVSLIKRIRLAVSRYEALEGGHAKGSPQSIRDEISRINDLRQVIRVNLPILERVVQKRHILQQIRTIKERESNSRGILKSMLYGSMSEAAREQIELLKTSLPNGDTNTVFQEDVSVDMLKSHDMILARYEDILHKSIQPAEERQKSRAQSTARAATERALAQERQIEKEARILAMAAAHIGKTRQLAQTVRRNIDHQKAVLPVCPYCESALGANPEADHIYPVARGGLSTEENMVYVCAPCNGRKRDKTLREFVKVMQFDQLAVERRLELLGKRF
jgi:5-methylcytosine-specific restriction endonuclease McrA